MTADRATTPLLLALALSGCLCGQAAADSPARPNIVLILADDLGFGDLGCYGARDMRTPHLDALASAGVLLENFYANCPVCSPTRAALLTGRYMELVGVPGVIRTEAANSWGWLAPQAELLPARLNKAGYHTAIVGKWHLGLQAPNTPLQRGFDHFHGFLGDMMDDYYHHRRHGHNYMRLDEEPIDPAGHATDLFTDWAIDYVRSRATSSQPFSLYLAYNAPHTPIQPPDDWLASVEARQPDMPPRRARLVALIEHMDHGIGRLLKALQDTGAADNTLLVFTSDNGGQLDQGANNGPWRGGKQQVYEGGLRVPAIAVWPGKIAPGARSGVVALSMDLFPTLCEAAGADCDPTIDGRSILPALLGQPAAAPERDLFFSRREGGNAYMGQTIQAVRRGDWKLLQNSPLAPYELYNLRDDPREQHDLAKANPRVFNELASSLRLHIQRSGAVPWQPPSQSAPPSTR